MASLPDWVIIAWGLGVAGGIWGLERGLARVSRQLNRVLDVLDKRPFREGPDLFSD